MTDAFSHNRLNQMIDLRHPLTPYVTIVVWSLEETNSIH